MSDQPPEAGVHNPDSPATPISKKSRSKSSKHGKRAEKKLQDDSAAPKLISSLSRAELQAHRSVTQPYLRVASVRQFVSELTRSNDSEPETPPSPSTASIPADSPPVYRHGKTGRAGVLSNELLMQRHQSTRKLQQKVQTSNNSSLLRSQSLRGASGTKTKYADYTDTPELAPDPVAKKQQLRGIGSDETKEVLSVVLIDGRTTKVFVTSSFTGSDVFAAVIERVGLYQSDLFWIAAETNEGQQWLSSDMTLSQLGVQLGPTASPLYLRMRWFKTYFKLTDSAALNLIYLQLSKMVVSAVYPVSHKLATRLGAVFVQLNYGNFVRAKHRPATLDSVSSEYLQTRIFSFHRRLSGISQVDLQRLYLTLCKECYYWGVTWFESTKFRIGVAEDGVFIPSPTAADLMWMPFEYLRGIQLNSSGLQLTSTSESRTFDFSPAQAKAAYELITGYYVILCLQATAGTSSKYLPEDLQQLRAQNLPNFMSFMRPKLREPEAAQGSLLESLRDSYLDVCKSANQQPNNRFLLQVENRLDNEEVLDILDMRKAGLDDSGLKLIAKAFDAVYKAKSYVERCYQTHRCNLCYVLTSRAGDALGEIITLTKARRVDISTNQLGPLGAQAFAQALGSKAKLEELEIGGNGIGDVGLSHIFNCLANFPKLTALHIQHNNISSTSGDVLAAFLSSHTALKALDISDNPLGDSGVVKAMQALVSSGIKLDYLNLTQVQASPLAVQEVINYIKTNPDLSGLRMAYFFATSDKKSSRWDLDLVQAIVRPDKMVMLDLSHCSLSKQSIKALFDHIGSTKALQELYLSGNQVSASNADVLAASLSRNTSLAKLYLRYCGLAKDEFIRLCNGLSQNSNLVELDLASNDLTHSKACDALANVFVTNPSKKFPTKSFTILAELNLADCGIGPKQMEDLIEGLARNESLVRLHLDSNELGMRGFRSLAIGMAMQPSIRILTVQRCGLDANDVAEFIEKLTSACHLDVLDCRRNPNILASDRLASVLRRGNQRTVMFDSIEESTLQQMKGLAPAQ